MTFRMMANVLLQINNGLPPGIDLISADNFEEWLLDLRVLDQNPLYQDQVYRLKFHFSSSYPIGMQVIRKPSFSVPGRPRRSSLAD